ncbi:MAG TPA: hypothetical protein DIT97_21675 [Gimesia maris]|uniref:Uncharacterized protein n=1 Tax=Gimesia maris TaxID=122 RepID=A0A3D3RD13_9PLAN|nr:hypothetical protein [Gimesia maris]
MESASSLIIASLNLFIRSGSTWRRFSKTGNSLKIMLWQFMPEHFFIGKA